MREINKIIVHAADTYEHMDIGVEDIREWHVDGNGWSDIGYHYVIRRNGKIEKGREDEVSGAHARGHNSDSIGICLVGGRGASGDPEANFTWKQWAALRDLCESLQTRYAGAEIIGHCDVSDKACPSFNVKAWRDA